MFKSGNSRKHIVGELRSIAVSFFVVVASWLAAPQAEAQDAATEKFTEDSLQYRTALHYDPLLDQQLEALVRLYQEADRSEELIGLYRSHIEQYPDDAGAKSVLIRLLQKLDLPGAGELLASSIPLHPQYAPLHYLLFLFLDGKGDPRAVESLSKAIDLESNPARRNKWLEELLKLSEDEVARRSAEEQLAKLLAVENQPAGQLLNLARLMQRYRFWEMSLAALMRARAAGLPVDDQVEADLLSARVQSELGNRSAAAKTLDDLLGRLAPDHWQRREIMSMRMNVVATEEERSEIIGQFKARYEEQPDSEAAVLDYAEVLIGSERQSEAARILAESASRFPASRPIESRAVEMMDSLSDLDAFETFLLERLELNPERSDLRFRLVKLYYALGRDGDAEQEFRAVAAALEPERLPTQLLELQRYLRGIDRIDAAEGYLARFVRNHPARLDVARELAEIYLELGMRSELESLVQGMEPGAASSEAVADFVEFLRAEQFLVSARRVLEEKLSSEETETFELNLLLIEVLGELGDATAAAQAISRVREGTDDPGRYRRWLEASVFANRNLENLDRFFDQEQNRFVFDGGDWPESKVEKFVILCEIGRQRLPVDRVLQAVRGRLAAGTTDPKLRVRLRRFLVGILSTDPAMLEEMQESLRLLETEDPANRTAYQLQRALAYHRSQRVDLAKELLAGVDFSGVKEVSLLQEAVGALTGLGFLKEAESALAAINSLSPQDIFSWEKRLTLLAALGEEASFRSLARQLRTGEASVRLRESSQVALDRHLIASYWRSASRLIASGEARRFEEVLPLLAAVDREASGPIASGWTEWSRAMVLQTLGREGEAAEAMERLKRFATRTDSGPVEFPDGMALSMEGAERFLHRPRRGEAGDGDRNAEFLLNGISMRWAFELEPSARIERFGRSRDSILVLDHRGRVHALDPGNGKLLWTKALGSERPAGVVQASETTLSGRFPVERSDKTTPEAAVKMAPPFEVVEDWFFLVSGERLEARDAASGTRIWSAVLPFSPIEEIDFPRSGARPGILIRANLEHVVAFQPETGESACFDAPGGKLLWQRRNETGEFAASGRDLSGGAKPGAAGLAGKEVGLFSLNAGLDLKDGLVLLYGWETAILDAGTGHSLWDFTGRGGVTFPVVLRRDRNGTELQVSKGTEASSLSEEEAETPSWQLGWRTESSLGVNLFDYLAPKSRRSADTSLFRETQDETTAMLSPAAYWARARLHHGQSAMGRIEDGYLWLMQEGRVRRVSTRFPVASRELPGKGTFLGKAGNHVWFLDGSVLRHLDFNYDRVTTVEIAEVGGRTNRATLVGNQLVVSGAAGVRVINALTGRTIGSTQWPEGLSDYLDAVDVGEAGEPEKALWQGEVRNSGPGSPNYCIPLGGLVGPDEYIARFGESVLVSFGSRDAASSKQESDSAEIASD